MRARTYLFLSVIVLVFTALGFLLTGCSDDPTAPAQSGPVTFSRVLGGPYTDLAQDVVATGAGLRVVTGSFNDSLRITGSGDHLVSAGGSTDMYLAAFREDGSLAWRRRYGGDGSEVPYGIARDADDNLLIGGSYRGPTEFGGTSLFEFGDNDILAAKLDSQGNVIWATGGGGGASDWATDVISSSDGSAFICGHAEGGPFEFAGLTIGEAGRSGFIVKLSALGGGIWAGIASGTSDAEMLGLALMSDGSVFVCGQAPADTLSIGGNDHTVDGQADGFVARFSDTGSPLNVLLIAGSGRSVPAGVVATGDDIVVAGSFTGTIDVAPFEPGGELTAAAGDGFVVRYQPNESVLWARKLGSGGGGPITAICRIGTEDLLVCGFFSGTVSFDSYTLTTNGVEDVFVARLNGDGQVTWAGSIGSSGGDYPTAVAAAGDSPLVVGTVSGDTRFSDGTIQDGFGGIDGFVFQR